METIAPSVVIDGKTVIPKNWMWILGFAIGGCGWAIKEASKPDFIEKVRKDPVKNRAADIEETILKYEQRINCLKEELESL